MGAGLHSLTHQEGQNGVLGQAGFDIFYMDPVIGTGLRTINQEGDWIALKVVSTGVAGSIDVNVNSDIGDMLSDDGSTGLQLITDGVKDMIFYGNFSKINTIENLGSGEVLIAYRR